MKIILTHWNYTLTVLLQYFLNLTSNWAWFLLNIITLNCLFYYSLICLFFFLSPLHHNKDWLSLKMWNKYALHISSSSSTCWPSKCFSLKNNNNYLTHVHTYSIHMYVCMYILTHLCLLIPCSKSSSCYSLILCVSYPYIQYRTKHKHPLSILFIC